jgi:hypothetical protein
MKNTFPIFLSLTFLAFSACNNSNNETEEQISELKSIASDLISKPEITIEEVNKLRQFEYKIVKFPSGSTSEEIHNQLNELGKEFWDCFAVEKSEENDLFIFCKKKPETPLRYVPKGILPH